MLSGIHSFLLRLAVLIGALALVACAPAQERGPVVLAASSLQDAMEDLADGWEAKGHPRPVLSFAASSALARQVEGGAPADLFLSADQEWMDWLARRNLIRPATRNDIATSRLVLVAPADAQPMGEEPGEAELLSRLGDGRLAMGEPGSVPAGRYARAALEQLGLWAAIEGRIAPAENVRAALALVERREAPLGIVYATDARASDAVRIVWTFPERVHPPISYPGALLADSRHADAPGFLAFISGEEGADILASHGFGPAP